MTLPGEAMGAILERSGHARTVYIFAPAVERTIGLASMAECFTMEGRPMVWCALARVLAHETVHAIDPDIPHGPEGSVMNANLTSALLLGNRLSLHESTTTSLLKSLAASQHRRLKRGRSRAPCCRLIPHHWAMAPRPTCSS